MLKGPTRPLECAILTKVVISLPALGQVSMYGQRAQLRDAPGANQEGIGLPSFLSVAHM